MVMLKRLFTILLAVMLFLSTALSEPAEVLADESFAVTDGISVERGYDYVTPGEVSLYLYVFGELPPNYLTKAEARDMGWVSSEGNLWNIGYGLTIGGDVFGNREGLLPDAKGRTWYECDVNYFGGFRGGERLVFATDGLIYYTMDHYESFELLYDGWFDPDYRYGEEEVDSYDEGWWSWLW